MASRTVIVQRRCQCGVALGAISLVSRWEPALVPERRIGFEIRNDGSEIRRWCGRERGQDGPDAIEVGWNIDREAYG